MLIAYKIVISLVALTHIIGFIMGVFMPESTLKQFGIEYSEDLQKIAVHFGLLLMIFAAFLSLAAYWTFKGKVEGIKLGIVAGIGLSLAFILDTIIVGQELDYPLLIMGVLTTGTAFLALRSSSSRPT